MIRVALLVLMTTVLAACADDAPTTQAPPAHKQTLDADGLRVELALSTTTPTLVDPVRLTITLITDPGVIAEPIAMPFESPSELSPDPRPSLGGLTLVQSRPLTPMIDDDRRQHARHEFTLEPFLPGDLTIPPIVFSAVAAVGERRTLTSEPIDLSVPSMLEGDGAEGVGPLRARASAESSPAPWWHQPTTPLIAFAAAAALVFALSRIGRTRAGPDVILASLRRLRAISKTESPTHDPAEIAALTQLIAQARANAAPGARLAEIAPDLPPTLREDAQRLATDLDDALYRPQHTADHRALAQHAVALAERLTKEGAV
ncbi:MAG: hypothetical protein AAGK04_09585 [Planctomycetota bacterium]